MSPNVQEPDSKIRKRSHDEFAESALKASEQEDVKMSNASSAADTLSVPQLEASSRLTPQGSPALTETASSTPAPKSPSPQTPAKDESTKASTVNISAASLKPSVLAAAGATTSQPKSSGTSSATTSQAKPTGQPPAKKSRLTDAEKEAREKEAAEKKREREEKLAVKAVEKAKAEEEKAARAKEREEKKKKKEEEQKRVQEEKDEKKRQKEEGQKRLQEEKDKKARAQPTLAQFFKGNTPKKTSTAVAQTEPAETSSPTKKAQKQSKTEYEKLFKPFFVKEHTKLAPLGPNFDEETRDVKSQILDEYFAGKRGEEGNPGFDPVQLFALPGKPPKRGKLHHPVRHIMEQVYQDTEKVGKTGPDHANNIIKTAREKLAKIPIKVIAFSRDVRPPYYGTMTFKPFALGQANLSQLGRKPTSRGLPLDYDYDSEAEWQEEEEGEDLDMDDEEEELEDEDDMDGFLDDSDDIGLSRRIFANAMEPDVTGICFENEKRVGPSALAYQHKMEIMHDGMGSCNIDPFSTKYWESEPKAKAKVSKPAKDAESGRKMAPPPAPGNAFAALTGQTASGEALKLVKSEILDDVKKAILVNSALSKAGIVDYIFQQFRDSVSRAEVKNTLELVAEKTGTGRQKMWTLKPGHEIAS